MRPRARCVVRALAVYAPRMSYMVKLASGRVVTGLDGSTAVIRRPLDPRARANWNALVAPGLHTATVRTYRDTPLYGSSDLGWSASGTRVAYLLSGPWEGFAPGLFGAFSAADRWMYDPDREPTPDPSDPPATSRGVLLPRAPRPLVTPSTLADCFVGGEVLLYQGEADGFTRWDLGAVVGDGSTVWVPPGDEGARVYLPASTPAARVRDSTTPPTIRDGASTERLTFRVEGTSAGGGLWLKGSSTGTAHEVYTDTPTTLGALMGLGGVVAEIGRGVWAFVV